MKDRTQSCVVISRSVEKYVTEHALDHTHCDARSESKGGLVAINPRRVQSQASSWSSSVNAVLTIGQRRWKAFPADQWVEISCYWISKRVTTIFCHHDELSSRSNRMGKAALPILSRRSPCRCQKLGTQEWIDQLTRGSNKPRSQYCLDSMGNFLCMRALQSLCGGNSFDQILQDNVGVLY